MPVSWFVCRFGHLLKKRIMGQKHIASRFIWFRYAALSTAVILSAPPLFAGTLVGSCYEAVPGIAPAEAQRALYILVDETTPLTETMRARVVALVSNWGNFGDRVKIARFSANINGRYPELVFAEAVEPRPGEAALYNMRYTDKAALLECLDRQKADFATLFSEHLKGTLKSVNPKIPKTDILYSLRELARNIILTDDAPEKTVLIVSDGLENSAVASFYRNGSLKMINAKKVVAAARSQRLIANWKGANIYMYGLAMNPSAKGYVQPKRLDALKNFWERYFVEGSGIVRDLGMPELFKGID